MVGGAPLAFFAGAMKGFTLGVLNGLDGVELCMQVARPTAWSAQVWLRRDMASVKVVYLQARRVGARMRADVGEGVSEGESMPCS